MLTAGPPIADEVDGPAAAPAAAPSGPGVPVAPAVDAFLGRVFARPAAVVAGAGVGGLAAMLSCPSVLCCDGAHPELVSDGCGRSRVPRAVSRAMYE